MVESLQSANNQLAALAIHLQNEDCRKEVIIRHKAAEAEKVAKEIVQMRRGIESMSVAINNQTGEMETYVDFVNVLKKDIAERDQQIKY